MSGINPDDERPPMQHALAPRDWSNGVHLISFAWTTSPAHTWGAGYSVYPVHDG